MRLIGNAGSAKGQQWPVEKGRLTIGREPSCSIYIPDPKISRVHAEIVKRSGKFYLVDCGSTNGTFVGNMRISEAKFRPGLKFRIGNTELEVKSDPDDLMEAAPPPEWEETASAITASVSLEEMQATLDASRTMVDESLHMAESGAFEADESRLERLARIAHHLHHIYDLAQELSETHTRDEILKKSLDHIMTVFPEVERCSILLKEKEDGDFEPIRTETREATIHSDFRISRSIFKQAVDERMGVIASDAASDKRFNASESVADLNLRSCMCAPMVAKGSTLGGIYVDNPKRPAVFSPDDLELLVAMAQHIGLALQNALLYERIQGFYHQAILSLIATIEAKDPYTMGHTQRTMRYAVGIGRELSMDEEELETLKTAAQLHDIGKIGVAENVLSKDSQLTAEEYDDIKAHVVIGVKILEPIEYLGDILPIVRGHHEKFDGSGYPDGLTGEEIPLGARILGLADAFDAMTTQRPYNRPFTFEQALDRCRQGASKHFDPLCVEALARFVKNNLIDGTKTKQQHKKDVELPESTVAP